MKNGILTFGLLGAQVKVAGFSLKHHINLLYNLLMLGSFVLQSICSLVTEYQDSFIICLLVSTIFLHFTF